MELKKQLTVITGGRVPSAVTKAGIPVIRAAWVDPKAHLLYAERMRCAEEVKTPFFVMIDGFEDSVPEDWLEKIEALITKMEEEKTAIGYGSEVVKGVLIPATPFTFEGYLARFTNPHHSIVFRKATFDKVRWPVGCYWFEMLVVGSLARAEGASYIDDVTYHYTPSPDGARLWPSTVRGIMNSKHWLLGLPQVHLQGEK